MIRSVMLLAVVGVTAIAPTAATALDASLGKAQWALLLALLCCSSFFSGSETAIFGLQAIDREAMKKAGPRGELVNRLRARPRKLLATLLMGNEFANVSLAAISAAIVVQLFPDQPAMNVLFVVPVIVLVGEILPKAIAIRFGYRWSLIVAPAVNLFATLVGPARWALDAVASRVTRKLGVPEKEERPELREEHIRALIDQGAAEGAINVTEHEMIHAVFEFDDIPIGRIMTPRADLVTLPSTAHWEEILAVVREHDVSRIPIWSGERDHIIGVLLTKDLLRFAGQPTPSSRKLIQLIHPPYFVPEAKRADDLLDEMQKKKLHIALVVNEHGSISGVITLTDLLEELVGEIEDETDRVERDILPDGEGRFAILGSVTIDDFGETTGILLPEGEYTTVGGFILELLGDLPQGGESVQWGSYAFEVVSVENRRIADVLVSPCTTSVPEELETEEREVS